MNWSVVVAVHNDEAVLEGTLLRSPALTQARSVLCQRGFSRVASAYAAALRECEEEVVLFVHPDVYLPLQWTEALEQSLQWLEEHDPNWGVIGLWGVAKEGDGHGFSYSTGLGGYFGEPFSIPREVRTVDEFAFLVRRKNGLRFDEGLPSAQFQLGATDLCLQAESRGMRCYAISGFAIHNSNRWDYLPTSFWRCYLYVRNKWRRALPVQTPYARVTVGCTPLVRETLSGWFRKGGTHRRTTRVSDPAALYDSLRGEINRIVQKTATPAQNRR